MTSTASGRGNRPGVRRNANSEDPMERWTESAANAWWSERPWVCGFNFLPSSAVNILEMWRRETFDLETIERELGWAGEIGFNSVRVNLHYLVWKHDPDGLLERLDSLMGVADRHGMSTVPCLFDDCGFGGIEPLYGDQPEPVPGVHNSRAVASPGRAMLFDASERTGFEAYVRGLARAFREDPRILFWDLYNEPGNRMLFDSEGFSVFEPDTAEASLSLMRDCFDWSRDEKPAQPLSVAAWTTPLPGTKAAPYQTAIDQAALELSDIVTFHAYWDADHVRAFIDHLSGLNRPMLCTEWMARPIGSRIEDQLPLYRRRDVGCFQWGLVQGRSQTTLPWPAALVRAHGGHADRSVWFHDILTADGEPYDRAETDLIASQVSIASPTQTSTGTA